MTTAQFSVELQLIKNFEAKEAEHLVYAEFMLEERRRAIKALFPMGSMWRVTNVGTVVIVRRVENFTVYAFNSTENEARGYSYLSLFPYQKP